MRVKDINNRSVSNTYISDIKRKNIKETNEDNYGQLCDDDAYSDILSDFSFEDYYANHSFNKTGIKFVDGRCYIPLNRLDKKKIKNIYKNTVETYYKRVETYYKRVPVNYLVISMNPIDKLYSSTKQPYSTCHELHSGNYSSFVPIFAANGGTGIVYITTGSFGNDNLGSYSFRPPKMQGMFLVACDDSGKFFIPNIYKETGYSKHKKERVNNIYCNGASGTARIFTYLLSKLFRLSTRRQAPFNNDYLDEIDDNDYTYYLDTFTIYGNTGESSSSDNDLSCERKLEGDEVGAMICEGCGNTCHEDDVYWCEDTEDYRCENCCYYCDTCNKYHSGEPELSFDGYNYCSAECAYNAGYSPCDKCGEWHHEDYTRLVYVDGDELYLCDDCRNDYSCIEVKGELVDISNIDLDANISEEEYIEENKDSLDDDIDTLTTDYIINNHTFNYGYSNHTDCSDLTSDEASLLIETFASYYAECKSNLEQALDKHNKQNKTSTQDKEKDNE